MTAQASPAQQRDLFTPDAVAVAQASDEVLLRDLADAACVLSMGTAGVGAHTLMQLRGEILTAVAELRRRWEGT